MSEEEKQGYTVLPNKIFELGLKSTTLHVLVFIFKWKNSSHSNMSLSFIENGTGLSRNTVIQSIKLLEENKCIVVNRKKTINSIIINLAFFELKKKNKKIEKTKKPPQKGEFKTKYMESCEDMFGKAVRNK